MSILTAIQDKKRKPLVLVGIALFFSFLPLSPLYADNGEAALIAARDADIKVMSLINIRRLYLGLKSTDSIAVKKPVLNMQSKMLYDDFMKNVMHMTEGSYKRKLVKSLFRQGRKEIRVMTSLKDINEHLLKNIGDISFVNIADVESMENVEIIQILW